MGPAIVISIGLLFLLSEMRGGYFDFSNTWPVILLVIGAIQLICALSPTEGHIGNGSIPPPSPGAMPPPPSSSFPGQGR
jgi:cell wall-active antibiotic response 4TMS protein YvqF